MPFPPSPRPVFVFSAAKVVPFGLATIATSLVATSLTAVSLTAVSLTTAMTSPAIAQLIPDNTLGQESSVVTPAQLGQWQGDRIDGGAIRGSALFHSFEEFNVETGRAAYFANPAGIEAILGRVTGQNHSDISGRLGVLGNANLFLLNPNGIVFGPDASLDIRGSFAATTADTFTFADGQFFSAVDPEAPPLLTMNLTTPGLQYGAGQSGSIINAADLAVNAGETLTLTGETVVNTGRLTAPGGEVAIAAITGDTHIQLGQNGGIQEITSLDDLQRSPRSLPQSNVQTISDIVDSTDADLGLAMTADGRVMLTDSGTLIPTDPGDTVVSGSLDAANLNRGQRGGQVRVMGDRVALVDEAWVNVAGDRGGGQALIGGEYQGRGDRLNADQTYIGPETRILADAVTSGDGGRVILWADGNTRFYGEISARGGINGNGGFVEVSGKTSLTYRGTVTTSALGGNRGTLLLDPVNITIANGDGDGGIDDIDDGVLAGESPGEDITIFEATLEALAGETNVILEATNNITVEDLADDELLFQGGPGDLGEITLEADADGDGVGAFTMVDVMDTLITRGRSIEISGAELIVGNIDTEPDVNFAANDGGTIELIATNGDLTAGNLVASGIDGIGGNITLSANGGNVNLVDSQIISDTDLPLTGQGEEEFSQIAIGAFATSLTNPAAAPNGGLVLLDGARVSVENLFDGIAGDIFINAENGITITDSFLTANGNTGVIEIGITDVETVRAQETAIPQTVTITDSEFTSSNNNTGEGQAAGNISINANGSVSIINSNLSTNGNQGSIDIGISGNTRGVLQTVEVNDSSITAANKNPGEDQNAGNVAIAATNTISILNSSRLSTDGNLGTITLGVSEEFDGVPQTIAITDSRLTASSLNAESIAGDIFIQADDQVTIGTSTLSTNGNEGIFTIDAGNAIAITDSNISTNGTEGTIAIGVGDDNTSLPQTVEITRSAITSSTNPDNPNSQIAGNITIDANNSIVIADNSILSTNGNDGRVQLGAGSDRGGIPQTMTITGSEITAANKEEGDDQVAGNVAIAATDTISILNNSRLSTDGNEGSITLGVSEEFDGVPQTIAITDSRLTASSLNAESIAGDMLIRADDQVTISTSTLSTNGNEGIFTIDAGNAIAITDSTVSTNGTEGSITIGVVDDNTSLPQTVTITRSILTSSTNPDNPNSQIAGNITIDASTSITVADNSALSTNGNDGRIELGAGSDRGEIPQTIAISGSEITAANKEEGDEQVAGNVAIAATDTISILNNSRLSTDGNLGTITLGINETSDGVPQTITITDSRLTASSRDAESIAGDIFIQADDQVTIGTSTLSTNGNEGVFTIDAGNAIAITDSTVSTNGNDGSITIGGGDDNTNMPQTVAITRSTLTSSTNPDNPNSQIAGNIAIDANNSITTDNSTLSTNGNDGRIQLGMGSDRGGIPQTMTISGSEITAANKEEGDEQVAGNVAIAATDTISILNGSRLSTDGNLGTITLGINETSDEVPQTITITDSRLTASSLNAESAAGDLLLQSGDQVTLGASTLATNGNEGEVTIDADNTIAITDSTVSTNGNEGTITLGEGDDNTSIPQTVTITRSTLTSSTNPDNPNSQIAGNMTINADVGIVIFDSRLATDGNDGAIGIGTGTTLGGVPQQVSIRRSTITSSNDNGNIDQAAGDITLSASDRITLTNSSVSTNGGLGEIIIGDNEDFGRIPQTIRLSRSQITSSNGNINGVQNAGSIVLSAQRRVFSGNRSRIEAITTGIGEGGFVSLEAGERITIGTAPAKRGSIDVSTQGSGLGGSIFIDAPTVLLTRRASLNASTEASGEGGNIIIASLANDRSVQANNAIANRRLILENDALIRANAGRDSTAEGGFVEVRAGTISLAGGNIQTQALGNGDAGLVEVEAITLDITEGGEIAVNARGSGFAGDVDIRATTVTLRGGSAIAAETNSGGSTEEAADINLVGVEQLHLFEGSQITASTRTGQAGNILVNRINNPANTITLSGGSQLAVEATGPNNSPNNSASNSASNITDQITAQADSGASLGTAGNLTLYTRNLTVEEGSQMTVRSEAGVAGSLEIIANAVLLDEGILQATTAQNATDGQEGANITLRLGQYSLFPSDRLREQSLLLQNESQIAANAESMATGGNITINTPDGYVIGANPIRTGSDITANAGAGNGGRVDIEAIAIFGIKFRPIITPLNDITATSDQGQAGIVTVRTLVSEFEPGVLNLQSDVLDTPPIQSACGNQRERASSFRIVGRGGLPPRPSDVHAVPRILVPWLEHQPNPDSPMNIPMELENGDRSHLPPNPPLTHPTVTTHSSPIRIPFPNCARQVE